MNKDKYLYDLMVKNHSTIVGWFVHKGIVDKNDDDSLTFETFTKSLEDMGYTKK